jgi:hypothetical protein
MKNAESFRRGNFNDPDIQNSQLLCHILTVCLNPPVRIRSTYINSCQPGGWGKTRLPAPAAFNSNSDRTNPLGPMLRSSVSQNLFFLKLPIKKGCFNGWTFLGQDFHSGYQRYFA